MHLVLQPHQPQPEAGLRGGLPGGRPQVGDAADPNSEMALLIAETDPQPYWPEYGTERARIYLGPVNDEA